MDLQLEGKAAVVTGATRGIGRAIADLLADEGVNVAICARKADQVAAAVTDLAAKGVKAWGEAVDIADGAALKGFVTAVGERFGGIDILVSNASALLIGAREEDWRAMVEVDLLGAVNSFAAAQPFLGPRLARAGMRRS